MRLIGIPILLIGLTLLTFNGPYSRGFFRVQERLRVPFAYRSPGVVRIVAIAIGIGWTIGGLLILASVLRPR